MSGVLEELADGSHMHWCEGCNTVHVVPTHRGWTFNGNLQAPTFSPSVRHQWDFGERREPRCCHYLIREGRIEYCGDCWHALGGTTRPLLPLTSRRRSPP